MKSKSMCTTVGLIAMCLAGSAAAAGKPLYQTGPALSRSAAATAAAEPSLQRLLSAPSTANAQVVQLDAGAVTASEKLLELQLDGQTITATQAKVDALEGGFDLVDPAGVTVASPTDRPAGYPLIEMPDRNVATVDFQAAAKVLIALPADLRAQVDKIRASTVDDVTLTLSGGQRVVWGDSSDSAVKAQHLDRLLAQKPGEVKEYDVSSPGVGIIR